MFSELLKKNREEKARTCGNTTAKKEDGAVNFITRIFI